MKKNEYVSPELEIVEMTGLCNILAGSEGTETLPGQNGTDPYPGDYVPNN